MLKTLIIHELQQQLFSLRSTMALALIMLMFGISTVSFLIENKELKKNYENTASKQLEAKKSVSENASRLATMRQPFSLGPRGNAFISSCNNLDQSISIIYSAFNVFRFEQVQGKINPFVLPNKSVNWEFIIVMLFSFLAIVFAFDSISGEKEARTLALGLSNPVSRSTFFFGKFFGITIALFIFAVLGSLLSILILLVSSQVALTSSLIVEMLLFTVFSAIVLVCFVAIGIMISAFSYSSNISLLISLSVWLVFTFIIPQTALLLSNNIFKIEKSAVVWEKCNKSREAVEKSFPDGKWHSEGSNPFCPDHQIRANMMMAFMKNEKSFMDNYYNQMFDQFEKARYLTVLSPISMFEYGNEYLLYGGYTRFKRNWENLHNYQAQFFQWFKALDSKDPKSPHWLNPNEDYSSTRKPVKIEEIPVYTEQALPMGQRLVHVSKYVIILLLYTSVLLFVSLLRFSRYDVR